MTWCDGCGWNLSAPPRPPREETALTRVADALGRRLGDRLAAELARSPALAPKRTPAKVAAYALALLVHGASLALLVGGVALGVLAFPNIAALVAGFVMVGLAVLMRPRLGAVPDEGLLAREQAPTLYALADDVAAALEVKPVDLIVVPSEFNAGWQVAGIRRTRVLTLGLPLLAALEPAERVAVVAHELAHARNGDSTRGLVVGSAANALAEAYAIVWPGDGSDDEAAGLGLAFVVHGVLWLISRPLYGLLLLQLSLVLRDSQRAEYLADALAARVAGTDAVVAAHEKLLLSSALDGVVQSVSRASELDLFAELEAAIRRVPERERERRRRAARLEDARLEDTHPPTAMRIELLTRRDRRPGLVALDEEHSARIDAELAPLRAPLQRRLVDEYRDRLYA